MLHIPGRFTPKTLTATVAGWCFEGAWGGDLKALAHAVAPHAPYVEVELFPTETWEKLRELGVINAMALPLYGPDIAPFAIGFGSEGGELDQVLTTSRKLIDMCAEFEFPNVIAFTGYGPTDAAMADRCVKNLREIAPYAESKGVKLQLEMLNSHRYDGAMGGMKGHPGYAGNDIRYVADIVRRVDSPFVRLLYDLYHVRIMHGDELTALPEVFDLIGHVHLAQSPERTEISATGEIDFASALRKLVTMGYRGRVGIEYVPTKDAPADVAKDLGDALTLVNI